MTNRGNLMGVLGAAGVAGGLFLLTKSKTRPLARSRGFKAPSTVGQIMTPDPRFCLPETPIYDVAKQMVQYDCGEIPIVDNPQTKRPIGVVTDRDIVARLVAQAINPLDMHAETCMSAPVITISTDASIHECIQKMEKASVRRLPVVDSQGKLCGIVSQADIARFVGMNQAGELVECVSEPLEEASNVGKIRVG